MECFFNSQQGILGIDGKPKLNAKVTEQVLKNFPDANLMVCYPHTIVTKMKLKLLSGLRADFQLDGYYLNVFTKIF